MGHRVPGWPDKDQEITTGLFLSLSFSLSVALCHSMQLTQNYTHNPYIYLWVVCIYKYMSKYHGIHIITHTYKGCMFNSVSIAQNDTYIRIQLFYSSSERCK